MNREEFLNFRAMWVAEDVDWGELAGADGDGYVDGRNPQRRTEYLKSLGRYDVTLKMCYLDFDVAGSYSMKFRNQGFDTNSFLEPSAIKDESGANASYFYSYVTSPDVCYYDAKFEGRGKPAHDVAVYAETFRDVKAFNEISDRLGDFFRSLICEDLSKANAALSLLGAGAEADGSIGIIIRRSSGPDVSLTVFPASRG